MKKGEFEHKKDWEAAAYILSWVHRGKLAVTQQSGEVSGSRQPCVAELVSRQLAFEAVRRQEVSCACLCACGLKKVMTAISYTITRERKTVNVSDLRSSLETEGTLKITTTTKKMEGVR